MARSGRFSRDSRLTITRRTFASGAAPDSGSTDASGSTDTSASGATDGSNDGSNDGSIDGRKVSRSTPSGTRSRFGAPVRRNSAAEKLEVTMTWSAIRASRRFAASAAARSGNHAGVHGPRIASSRSCEKSTTRTRRRRAHRANHRRLTLSLTSSTSGRHSSSSRRIIRRRSTR
jgi:hypothetical protein